MNFVYWLTELSRKRAHSRYFTSFRKYSSAGIIVIGDEILKAQVKDSNCFFACNLLYKYGVRVKKISVVPDDVHDIAKEIVQFSKSYQYVITSGGIGPTHDDVTYEAAAMAFNDRLRHHPTLVDIIKTQFARQTDSSASYKMAHIPSKALLKFGRNETTGNALRYPCVILENVYIFPGSPTFFEISFQSIFKELFAEKKGFATTEVYINEKEESFANALSSVAKEYSHVTFGSYPERNRYYKARVTIESENEKDTEEARKKFCDFIPEDRLVHYDPAPHVDCVRKYETFVRDSEHRSTYQNSLEKLMTCYRSFEETSIYFDGSVEATILVHLARIVTTKLQNSERPLHVVCLESDYLRAGMNRFILELIDRYKIEVCTLSADENDDSRQTISKLSVLKPKIRRLLVGKRVYEDVDFPKFEISRPLLEWTDENVLSFANALFLPYNTMEENCYIGK